MTRRHSSLPSKPQADEPPLTVQQLADRWACSRDAVYALLRTGRLPSFRVGGKLLRIKADVVRGWENGDDTLSANTDCSSSTDRPVPSGETNPRVHCAWKAEVRPRRDRPA